MIYGVLTDPEKRKLYDERGEIGVTRKEKEDCACPEQKPKEPRAPREDVRNMTLKTMTLTKREWAE